MTASIREILSGRIGRIVAAVLFTAMMVVFVVRNVSVDALSACAAALTPLPTALMFLVYLGVAAARAGRFRVVGAEVSFRGAFEIALVHAALLRIMPLRSGELAYGILLKRRGAASLAKSLTDLVLLRVLDMAVVLPMAALVTALLLRSSLSTPLLVLAAVLGGVFLGVFLFGGRLARTLKSKVPTAAENRFQRIAQRLLDVLDVSFSLPRIKRVQLLGLTLLMWLGLILWFYFALTAVGAVSRFVEGAAAGTTGIVGSMLPLSLIGSFGPMEGGLGGGLIAIGHTHADALAEALIVSLLTFVCNLAWASLAWTSFALDKRDGTPSPQGASFRKALGTCLFGIGAAFVLLSKIPYGFETNDQLQYLLLPYRDIYTPFLTGDWFTWHTTHYHPFFGYFIRGLYAVSGEGGFPTAVFIVHIGVLFALGVSCLVAARSLKLHWIGAATAVLCTAFVRRYALGDVVVNHGVLLPADMAMPFLLMGFAAWVANKPLRSGLLLGLAGLIHANFAVIGLLVVAVPEILRLARTKNIGHSLRLGGGYLLLAWPSLITAFMGFFAADSAPEAIRILFEYRSPHHYHPNIFGNKEVYWPLALLVASLPVWWLERRQAEGRVVQLILALVASQVIAYAATFCWESTTIIRLFLWRLSVPLVLLCGIAFGHGLVCAARTRRIRDVVVAASTFLLVIAFVDGGPIMRRGWRIDPNRMRRSLTAVVFPTAKTVEGQRRVEPILTWIDRHAPKNAVFLAPPGTDDFRLRARRAVFVDWKCCPMKGDEIAEWARRMKAVIGTKTLPAKGYALHREGNRRYERRSLQSLAELAKKEGLTYVLAKNRGPVPPSLKKLVTKYGWSVYRVR